MEINWSQLLEPDSLAVVLIFGLPMVGIVVGGVVSLAKIVIRHRERIAMIEHGIHPDYPPVVKDDNSDTMEPTLP